MEQKVQSFQLTQQVTHLKINFQYLNLFSILVSFFFSSDLSQLLQFIFNIQKPIVSLFLSFIGHLQFQLLRDLLVENYLLNLLLLFLIRQFYLVPKWIELQLHLIYSHILNHPSFDLNQNYEYYYRMTAVAGFQIIVILLFPVQTLLFHLKQHNYQKQYQESPFITFPFSSLQTLLELSNSSYLVTQEKH